MYGLTNRFTPDSLRSGLKCLAIYLVFLFVPGASFADDPQPTLPR